MKWPLRTGVFSPTTWQSNPFDYSKALDMTHIEAVPLPRLRIFKSIFNIALVENFSRLLAAFPALETLKFESLSTHPVQDDVNILQRDFGTMLCNVSACLTTLSLRHVWIDAGCVEDVLFPNLNTLILDECGHGAFSVAVSLTRSTASLQHLHIICRHDFTPSVVLLSDLPRAQLLSLHMNLDSSNLDGMYAVTQDMLKNGVFEKLRCARFITAPRITVARTENLCGLCGVVMPELQTLQLCDSLSHPSSSIYDSNHIEGFSKLMAPSLRHLILMSKCVPNIQDSLEEVRRKLALNSEVPDDVVVRSCDYLPDWMPSCLLSTLSY